MSGTSLEELGAFSILHAEFIILALIVFVNLTSKSILPEDKLMAQDILLSSPLSRTSLAESAYESILNGIINGQFALVIC